MPHKGVNFFDENQQFLTKSLTRVKNQDIL